MIILNGSIQQVHTRVSFSWKICKCMKYVDFIVLYHASLEFSVGWKTDEQKWYGICVLSVGLCVCVNLVSFIGVPNVENKFHKIQ